MSSEPSRPAPDLPSSDSRRAALDLATGRGTLVVDLNFAYNPSCAYDPAWMCPLAQPGNTLAAPVRVGELYPVVPRVSP